MYRVGLFFAALRRLRRPTSTAARTRRTGAAILLRAQVLAWLVLASCCSSATAADSASLHPQDGPHVDLRLELRGDAFVVEASMNLLFLDEMLDTGREQPDRIELSELRAMKSALTARVAEICRVVIDGRLVAPLIEGLAKNDPDEALLPLFPRSGFRGLRKVRFEVHYPLTASEEDPAAIAPPRTISFTWLLYPTDVLSIEDPQPPIQLATELIIDGVRSDVLLRVDEPEFTWHRPAGGSGIDARLQPVPVPVAPATRRGVPSIIAWLGFGAIGIGAIGLLARRRVVAPIALIAAGLMLVLSGPALRARSGPREALPDEAAVAEVFRPLHANLYRAFDFVDDGAIYDALSRSVDGPLLEELFLTIHRSLVMQEEGGAVSRVRALREQSLAIESIGLVESDRSEVAGGLSGGASVARPGFVVRYRYQVDGRVTHWGHTHDRTNEYLARYTVIARPDGWRIASAEVLEQARVDLPADGVRDDGTFEL